MPENHDRLERYEMFYEEIGSFQLFDQVDIQTSNDPQEGYDSSYMSHEAVNQISLDAHGEDLSEHLTENTEDQQ